MACIAIAMAPVKGVPPADAVTQVAMRNVDFYVDPEVVLHIHRLRGTMVSKHRGPVLFDDKRSFIIHIATAEVGLTGNDLTALMNKYVFAYRGAPLKRMKVWTEGTGVVQTGLLHKGFDIPFAMRASLDVTAQEMIRIHPTTMKMLGINGGPLMRFFGLTLEKLLDLRGAHGVSLHGNDMLLDPSNILPPPTIEGRVTAVRVAGSQVVQIFGGATEHNTLNPLIPPDPTSPLPVRSPGSGGAQGRCSRWCRIHRLLGVLTLENVGDFITTQAARRKGPA